MKVVSSKQMSRIESLAYKNGSSEADFMEEAGSGVALIVHDYIEHYQLDHQVILLCGKGNNAGDAYVAGIHLLHLEYEVVAYQLFPIEQCSQLCRNNYARFIREAGRVRDISNPHEIIFPERGIILDGIFGTGFHGEVAEPIASIIKMANSSGLPIIAIDIPSGLEGETGVIEGEAIRASETAFLGLPKTGFFLNQGWNAVGKLRYVDFGLPKNYIQDTEADFIMISKEMMRSLFPPLIRNRHKYQAGFVIGLAGSLNMPGAALLASIAALKGGAGMVHLLYPEVMQNQLVNSPFELIKLPYQHTDTQKIIDDLNAGTGTFIGPGLGRTPEVHQMLAKILPRLTKPCVLDADALYFLAENPDTQLPPKTILTPHLGELSRLLNIEVPHKIDQAFLMRCQKYTEEKQVTLILKGGPTYILHPGSLIHICPVGDPGMATAGTGDVLTGLLASLLSQGLSTNNAAYLGTFIHGLSGEHAAFELTSYTMTASDLLFYFPEGFRLIEH